MTTSPSPAAASQSSSNGVSPASLPRWRSFLSTLNWRPVREIEQRTRETEIAILRERQKRLRIEQQIEQMKREDEQMKREDERLEREHEQMRREDEQLEKEEEELEKEDEQIENEIEQL